MYVLYRQNETSIDNKQPNIVQAIKGKCNWIEFLSMTYCIILALKFMIVDQFRRKASLCSDLSTTRAPLQPYMVRYKCAYYWTEWIEKLTYLGCQFFSNLCKVDFNSNIQKFYGGLNNIISVPGKKQNEISCVHLVKTYCVPSLLYGCEVWNLSCAEY